MIPWVAPFILTFFTYLILGAWVLSKYKSHEQRLYAYLCLITAMWQNLWIVLFLNISTPFVSFWLKLSYGFIVFIPSIFHDFICAFTNHRSSTSWRIVPYGISGLLGFTLFFSDQFLNGFYFYKWGAAVRAGSLHPVFCVLTFTLTLRVVYVLIKARQIMCQESELRNRQWKWIVVATIIYSFGAVDLFTAYGIGIFPFSFFFTGISFVCFGYSLFRYKFLDIDSLKESEVDRQKQAVASIEMQKMGMTTAFPLVSQGELLGYLLLGEKMSEEAYSKEDLLLLRIVANQAALAYQRVRYLELAVRGARTEMLGAIAGGFAHEIRTPLANIRLPAELCFMDLADVEHGKRKLDEVLPELKARLNDIMNQTTKANEKIEAIRLFSKPGQTKLELAELMPVIHGSLSVLDHLVKKWDIRLHLTAPSTPAMIRANPKQLEIVFVNLFKNAIEAMALGKPEALSRDLRIDISEDSSWFCIRIKDSGPGIKRTDIGHLFDAYFTTKGSSGTGIGLFLSQQVIKAHGGLIDVQSEEGVGTEFVVRLPKVVVDAKQGITQAA